MNQEQLAEIICNQFDKHIDKASTQVFPRIFHSLGPPAIGKTFLQEELFCHWKDIDPVHLRASGFMQNRASRLGHCISECLEGAYDINSLKTAYMKLLSGKSVIVTKYNHSTGNTTKSHRTLKSSGLIYIEGPVWLKCYDIQIPDFLVYIYPKSVQAWRAAYLNRNIHYRSYSAQDAATAFGLASTGWEQSIARFRFPINIPVSVDFKEPNYHPIYNIVSLEKGDFY